MNRHETCWAHCTAHWDELRLHSLRSQGVRVAVASNLARSLPNSVCSMGVSENGTPKWQFEYV